MVRQAVLAGLLSSGCRVIDLDVCPVPTVQLLVRERRARGGIASPRATTRPSGTRSSSSTPPGSSSPPRRRASSSTSTTRASTRKVAGAEMREVDARGGRDRPARQGHPRRARAAPRLGAKAPRRRGLVQRRGLNRRAAAAGGARRRGVPVNTTPDGTFPRGAEPTPENLGELCRVVREAGADVGFAQDMDADRLAVVDEQGRPIGEEYTLVLAARYVLGARARGAGREPCDDRTRSTPWRASSTAPSTARR